MINVMSLFDALQRSVKALGNKADPDADSVRLVGFDGNNETKLMAYCQFMIEREDKFTYLRLGSDGVNSHMPMVASYLRMLPVWKQHGESYDLSAEQVKEIWEARRSV